jgi:hypothetical protein
MSKKNYPALTIKYQPTRADLVLAVVTIMKRKQKATPHKIYDLLTMLVESNGSKISNFHIKDKKLIEKADKIIDDIWPADLTTYGF